MSTTIIAMYDTPSQAEAAIAEIRRTGIDNGAVDLLQGGEEPSVLISRLTEGGVEAEEARIYAEAIAEGRAMVAVDAGDEAADDVFEILNRAGARDLDEIVARAASAGEADRVPVIEERVSIGKRAVRRGGVRITSVVSERPVAETVTLTEEKVSVERRPTDRVLTPEEAEKAFEEKTIEVLETVEEAVVRKEAHVVEEVTLARTATQREETVKATARRTDIRIEPIEPTEPSAPRDPAGPAA